jgi:hypothetical protein
VPVTETRQSDVFTYRWPSRCLAARTMTLPRARATVVPPEPRAIETWDLSASSTREPSVRTRTAPPERPVRTASPPASSAPAGIRVPAEGARRSPSTTSTRATGPEAAEERTNQNAPRAAPRRRDAARASAATGRRRAGAEVPASGTVTGCPERTALRARRHGTQDRVWSSTRSARAGESRPATNEGMRDWMSVQPRRTSGSSSTGTGAAGLVIASAARRTAASTADGSGSWFRMAATAFSRMSFFMTGLPLQ